MENALIRIISPYFVAGIEFSSNGSKCAPIINYMKWWNLSRIFDYCQSKKWACSLFEKGKWQDLM